MLQSTESDKLRGKTSLPFIQRPSTSHGVVIPTVKVIEDHSPRSLESSHTINSFSKLNSSPLIRNKQRQKLSPLEINSDKVIIHINEPNISNSLLNLTSNSSKETRSSQIFDLITQIRAVSAGGNGSRGKRKRLASSVTSHLLSIKEKQLDGISNVNEDDSMSLDEAALLGRIQDEVSRNSLINHKYLPPPRDSLWLPDNEFDTLENLEKQKNMKKLNSNFQNNYHDHNIDFSPYPFSLAGPLISYPSSSTATSQDIDYVNTPSKMNNIYGLKLVIDEPNVNDLYVSPQNKSRKSIVKTPLASSKVVNGVGLGSGINSKIMTPIMRRRSTSFSETPLPPSMLAKMSLPTDSMAESSSFEGNSMNNSFDESFADTNTEEIEEEQIFSHVEDDTFCEDFLANSEIDPNLSKEQRALLLKSIYANRHSNTPINQISKFKDKAFRKTLLQNNSILKQDENREVVRELKKSIKNFSDGRNSKNSLVSLFNYVAGRLQRNILNNWNVIEMRFKASPHYKMVTIIDGGDSVDNASYSPTQSQSSSSITQQIKQPAFYISGLIHLLCSSRVKIIHSELKEFLLERGITEEEFELGRRIACYHVSITAAKESSTPSPYLNQFNKVIKELTLKETVLISLSEFSSWIFSQNPLEKEKQLIYIRENRQVEAQEMMNEKIRKEDLKEQQNRRNRKLIEDFKRLLKQKQISKYMITQQVLDEFSSLVTYCKNVYSEYLEEQSTKLPTDIVYYLGIDAFPNEIKEKLEQKSEKFSIKNSDGPKLNVEEFLSKQVQSQDITTTKEDRINHLKNSSFRDLKNPLNEKNSLKEFSKSFDSTDSNKINSIRKSTYYKRLEPLRFYESFNFTNEKFFTELSELRKKLQSIDPLLYINHPIDMQKNRIFPFEFYYFMPGKVHTFNLSKKYKIGDDSKVASFSLNSLEILKKMVSIGKTFPGFSYRESVEIIQYISATKIASIVRCHLKYKKFTKAKQFWTKKFNAIKNEYFSIWAKKIKYFINIKRYCWRKIKAWNHYVKHVNYLRKVFCSCFWPFYTWKKYSNASSLAKQKSKLLTTRIMPTVTLIHVFKNWKKVIQDEVNRKKLIKKMLLKKQSKITIEMIRFWNKYSRQKKIIRKNWIKHGSLMSSTIKLRNIKYYFLVWRIYIRARIYSRQRVPREFYQFRKLFMDKLKIMKKLSFSEKRVICAIKHYASRRKAVINMPIQLTTSNKPSFSMTKSQARMSISNTRKISADLSISSSFSSNSAGSAEETELEKEVRLLKAEIKLRNERKFNWKSDYTNSFDYESDGEDSNDISNIIINAYNNSAFSSKYLSLVELKEISGKVKISELVLESILEPIYQSVHKSFSYKDYWNMFDATILFNKYAWLALKNLQFNAKISKKAKIYLINKRKNLLIKLFKAWVDYVEQLKNEHYEMGTRLDGMREADALVYYMKNHQTKKLTRTRHISSQIEKYNDLVNQQEKEYELAKQIAAAAGFNKNGESNDQDFEIPKSVEKSVLTKNTKRRKFYELINGDDFFEQMLEQERQAENERKENLLRKNQQKINVIDYIGNILELEDQDREMEYAIAKRMVIFSEKCKNAISDYLVKGQVSSEKSILNQSILSKFIENLSDKEGKHTEEAIERQMEYARKFKYHAIDLLLTVLVKIKEQVVHTLLRNELKTFFRALRLPMLISRSKKMLVRKRIKNWLRICIRLRNIDKKAPFYYSSRILWKVFNSWLKFIEQIKLETSSKLLPVLRRKLELYKSFNNDIISNSFSISSLFIGYKKKFMNYLNNFKVIFLRWKCYTQEKLFFKMLKNKVNEIYKYTLLKKCFWGLKTNGKPISQLFDIAKKDKNALICPCIIRYKADLDQILKRFVYLRKKNLLKIYKEQVNKQIESSKRSGKSALSFKKFMKLFSEEMSQRINSEQRILFESFEKRGQQDYQDCSFPRFCINNFEESYKIESAYTPPLMLRLDAKPFYDPIGACQQFQFGSKYSLDESRNQIFNPQLNVKPKNCVISSGFRVSKIKISLQNLPLSGAASTSSDPPSLGTSQPIPVIVGWQFIWQADGVTDVEAPARGIWHAAGVNYNEFIIPKDDFIIALDYYYEALYIVGMRLKLYHGGYTKWIGGKASLSTLMMTLDVSNSPNEDFEKFKINEKNYFRSSSYKEVEILSKIKYKKKIVDNSSFEVIDTESIPSEIFNGNNDITKNIAEDHNYNFYPQSFVIGFTGMIHQGRVVRPGLVIRKIKQQNIFSYFWVQDAIKLHKQMECSDVVVQNNDDEESKNNVDSTDLHSVPSQIFSKHIVDKNGKISSYSNFNDELTVSVCQPLNRKANTNKILEEDEIDDGSKDSIPDITDMIDDDFYNENQDNESSTDLDEFESQDEFDNDIGSKSKGKSKFELKIYQEKLKRKFEAINNSDDKEELVASETQFFDVLRMRIIELSDARKRSEEFARRCWTSKSLNNDPQLNKLLTINIITSLTKWLFNALNKNLSVPCKTEKEGLKLLKLSRQLEMRSKNLKVRSKQFLLTANKLLNTVMPWTGKHVLSPQDRQNKKIHTDKIENLKKLSLELEYEANLIVQDSIIAERVGQYLLPRIPILPQVIGNFSIKIYAARRKENLLERISLEDMKNGMLLSDMKSDFLSQDQIASIHESLNFKESKSRVTSAVNNNEFSSINDVFPLQKDDSFKFIDISISNPTPIPPNNKNNFLFTSPHPFIPSPELSLSSELIKNAATIKHSDLILSTKLEDLVDKLVDEESQLLEFKNAHRDLQKEVFQKYQNEQKKLIEKNKEIIKINENKEKIEKRKIDSSRVKTPKIKTKRTDIAINMPKPIALNPSIESLPDIKL